MLDLPKQRFIRNIVGTDLDFVSKFLCYIKVCVVRCVAGINETPAFFQVSVGGIVGLFFGASILSIVDIVYKIYRNRQKIRKVAELRLKIRPKKNFKKSQKIKGQRLQHFY